MDITESAPDSPIPLFILLNFSNNKNAYLTYFQLYDIMFANHINSALKKNSSRLKMDYRELEVAGI